MHQSEQISLNQAFEQTSIRDQINNSKQDPARYLNEDFLSVLNEHRKHCEREGKLEQALQARKRLKELRVLEENQKKHEAFDRHVSLAILTFSAT